MTTLRLPGIALGFLSLFPCTSMAAVATGNELAVSPGDRAFLDTHRAEHTAAMLAGRPEAIVKRYSDRVRVLPEYHPTLFGIADARAYHAAFFERFSVRGYAREPVDALRIGARIVEVGRFSLRLAPRNGGALLELPGKYLDIWAQSDGGAPELLSHGWNYDGRIAAENELRFDTIPGRRTALDAHVPVSDALSFELTALNRLHEAAIQQHDANVWSQFFAPDAMLLANHHTLMRGRAEIDPYVLAHAQQLPVFEKLDIRVDEIDAHGRYVIDYASHVANWRDGASSGVNTGKNIRIWRREPGGWLKMILQIGMYD